MIVDMSPTALRASVFGDNSGFMNDYITFQMNLMQQSFGNAGAAQSNSLYQELQSQQNYLNDHMRILHLRQELTNNNMSVYGDDFIGYTTFEEIQYANPTMQRYIMAMPEIRQMYLNGECDGYSGSYVDPNPNDKDLYNYDYRRATNGLSYVDEHGNDRFVVYHEELEEGDRELDIMQQHDIAITRETIRHILKGSNYDPTKVSAKPQPLFK